MHTLSPRTPLPTFSVILSSPLLASALAILRTPCLQHHSPHLTRSPCPPPLPNKLVVGSAGHSPSKQSTSLGRVTLGSVDGSGGGASRSGASRSGASGGSVGASASVPRQNSLGNLKIPMRISHVQVGLHQDLGIVREFAINIEC